jgi:anaerobic selenocysteine-containing dehydrogenase
MPSVETSADRAQRKPRGGERVTGGRHTVFRGCTLCEASCGLALEVEGDRIVSVRGDEEDVLSQGFICAKGVSIADVHHDPDRLRSPMRKRADGEFEPIGWDEAFALVGTRLSALRARYGADAIALYLGNPIIHNHGALLLRAGFVRAFGTRNSFSPGSQDTSPRFAASFHLYGSSLVTPVPDIDRTQYFLCVGANPAVSNGSLMTAPDVRRRLRAIRERGGRVVVVDPRRTETAREADQWVPIRPGGDAALLLAMTQTLVAAGRVDEARIAAVAHGWPQVRERLKAFTPERAAAQTGIAPETIRSLARDFADAPSSAAYTRVGVCNSRFGTLGSWATDVLNLAAGRLGAVGGAMFPTPPIAIAPIAPYLGLGDGHGRWVSRVRGLPEVFADLPANTLADEIETPGAGQVRALFVYAGNPVLSVPNSQRLSRALEKLEFMVAVDVSLNETTRHADVILPPAWTFAEDHFEGFAPNFAVRNFARFAPPVFARQGGERADWEILLEVAEQMGGGASGIYVVDRIIRIARRLGLRWTPNATIDMLLRLGPHGDRYLPWSRGLNLKRLAAMPHGADLGPLEPGVARRVLYRDGRMRLAPDVIMAALAELEKIDGRPPELVLIGRRDPRTNNSWMHNVPAMVAGRERCVLLVHPEDAARAQVRDGEIAILESRVHRGPVPVRVSEEMMPGVVSLPHGWGHAASAPWQQVAAAHAGVSVNDWTDDQDVEALVGQSILNGVPVRLRPAEAPGS